MAGASRFEMVDTDSGSERWQSVDAVAKHLGVARDTIYRWIEQKGLPANRVGRLWKFKFSEVDAWVRAGGASQATSVLHETTGAGHAGGAARTGGAR
jgi:excisionase family DNA binding protein